MTSQTLFSVGFAICVVFLLWTLSSTNDSPFTRSFPRLYNKSICLLIAHPDDEAMFFAPTVLSLTRPEYGNHLKILCLSSGDADGLGHIRTKELQESAVRLGLRSESDVLVLDDPSRFPDSMVKTWAENDVASILTSAFAPDTTTNSSKRKNANTNNAEPAPVATIDVLLTFDKDGISNHPNHRSLYHGAVHFLRTLMKDKHGYSCPVSLYTLTTTNIFRKYIGILDAPLTMIQGVLGNLISGKKKGEKKESPSRLLFISNVNEWMTAQSAMTNAHKSQMAWFRYGWITIGRYMAVNDLKQEKIV